MAQKLLGNKCIIVLDLDENGMHINRSKNPKT